MMSAMILNRTTSTPKINVTPITTEAKTLQDADRLDALGMLGVARCFYVAGRMGRALYDPADPHATQRPLDDTRYTLDHFRTREQQERALDILQFKLDILWTMLDAIEKAFPA